jgi:transposase-like protein
MTIEYNPNSKMPRYKCLKCGKPWEEWIIPVHNCPFCKSTNIKRENEFGEISRSNPKRRRRKRERK